MPVMRIETNQSLSQEATTDLMKAATDMLCRVLEKPKTFMMVSVDSGCRMMFDGSTDPCAFVQLRLFAVSDDDAPGIIHQISDFISEALDVKADRQYIQLMEMKPSHFGWNGKPC
jgi:phenylpyruvate tautomerase PptA (4-oxalocrotonate tautomerase family)